jgi:2-polyprenyl-3-methyl-5-hydroxy-6-metoxy-1,4-benzoquinol methylase
MMLDSSSRRPVFPITRILWLFSLLLLVGPTCNVASANQKDKERWDSKYGTEEYIFGKTPIPFLQAHIELLPKGKALDLAMGEGRNGVFLATQGFQVTGLDISENGLAKARKLAAEQHVSIETRVVDFETFQLEPHAYDVILCSYYLQRSLLGQIKQALRPGGMVMIETYNTDHAKYNSRFNKEYLLETNELLDWFKDFKILRYQTVDDGKAAYSSILAQKP